MVGLRYRVIEQIGEIMNNFDQSWDIIFEVRSAITAALEHLRQDKTIGSPRDPAAIDFCNERRKVYGTSKV